MSKKSGSWAEFWRARVSLLFVRRSLGIFFISHGMLWCGVAFYQQKSLLAVLSHYDAYWYNQLIQGGYGGDPKLWAFLPLYPGLIAALQGLVTRLSQHVFSAQVLGTLVSSGCFCAAAGLLILEKGATKHSHDSWTSDFTPLSRLGWLTFLFSPASYVFHSHHTESLFLLLAVIALKRAVSNQWVSAALWAGLASLTRIPGVFLAIAVALLASQSGKRERPLFFNFRRFLVSGLLSGSLFASYLYFQYTSTGNCFTLLQVQANWSVNGSLSLARTLRTVWFGNPSQHLGLNSFLHHPYTLWMLWGCVLLWKEKKWAVAIYSLLSLAIMFLQGELIQAYRFTAVLFPLLFCLGDFLAKPGVARNWMLWVFAGGGLAFNFLITLKYALESWAY